MTDPSSLPVWTGRRPLPSACKAHPVLGPLAALGLLAVLACGPGDAGDTGDESPAAGSEAAAVRDLPAVTWTASVTLDREEPKADGGALTSSTQSLNRYASVLRDLDRIEITLDAEDRLSFELSGDRSEGRLLARGVELRHLTPLLPYPRSGVADAFDLASLMLAEYARNGVELSFQESNEEVAFFHDGDSLFGDEGDTEYFLEGEELRPNPRVRPKRFSVVNNCLDPGLWELSAKDSVGEMFHGWVELPREAYLELVRRSNGFELPDDELATGLAYRADLSSVPLELERLRRVGDGETFETVADVAAAKKIGGYSTQDSRRKVQRGFFELRRGDEPLAATTFGDLRAGDVFSLFVFHPPGVYSSRQRRTITYDPDWRRVEIRDVEPLTRYSERHRPTAGELGHVEIRVHSSDGERMLVAGNLPVALLVEQEDFAIPAFGVGVLPPSEPVEQRHLRLTEGPVPSYAYLAQRAEDGEDGEDGEDDWRLVNNHETGYEQIFLRPFEREGQLYLRFTAVAYERIVDVLELEIPVEGDLATRLREASRIYRPPLYRVYRDDNVL